MPDGQERNRFALPAVPQAGPNRFEIVQVEEEPRFDLPASVEEDRDSFIERLALALEEAPTLPTPVDPTGIPGRVGTFVAAQALEMARSIYAFGRLAVEDVVDLDLESVKRRISRQIERVKSGDISAVFPREELRIRAAELGMTEEDADRAFMGGLFLSTLPVPVRTPAALVGAPLKRAAFGAAVETPVGFAFGALAAPEDVSPLEEGLKTSAMFAIGGGFFRAVGLGGTRAAAPGTAARETAETIVEQTGGVRLSGLVHKAEEIPETAIIVYRGGEGLKRGRTGFFSSSRDAAARFGPVHEVILEIENPLVVKSWPDAFRRLSKGKRSFVAVEASLKRRKFDGLIVEKGEGGFREYFVPGASRKVLSSKALPAELVPQVVRKEAAGSVLELTEKELAEGVSAVRELQEISALGRAAEAAPTAGLKVAAQVATEGTLSSRLLKAVMAHSKDGNVKLSKSARLVLINELGRDAAKLSDNELLRLAGERNILSEPHILNSLKVKSEIGAFDLLAFLGKSKGTGIGNITVVGSTPDIFLGALFGTPSRIAAKFPEVAPLVERARASSQNAMEWLADVNGRLALTLKALTKKEQNQLQELLHSFDDLSKLPAGVPVKLQTHFSIWRSFFRNTADALRQLKGVDAKWIPNYFPIVHVGRWRLEHQGRFIRLGSLDEAMETAGELLNKNPNAKFLITPHEPWLDDATYTLLKPRAFWATFDKVQKTLKINQDEAFRLLEAAGVQMRPGKRFFGALEPRRSGIRDYAADFETSMRVYAYGASRKLFFNDFRQFYESSIVPQIPRGNSNLLWWSRNYVDQVMGAPWFAERALMTIAERLNIVTRKTGIPIEFTGTQWLSFLRAVEAISKLGFSPITATLNLSQLVINTYPTLGAKFTVRGLRDVLALVDPDRSKGERALLNMLKDEFTPELRVPLTAEGRNINPLTHVRGPVDLLNFLALFMFNGVERVNRLATGFGTYRLATSRGATHRQAIALARGGLPVNAAPPALQTFAARNPQGTITRTQFRYAIDDMPLVLRGPVLQTLGQFKSFVIKEFEFMSSLRGAEIPRFLGALWAAGGAAAILNTPLGDLANFVTDRNLRDELRVKVKEDDALRILVYGAPGLLGVDWADYLGIGRVADVMRGFFGPAVSDMKELAIFLNSVKKHGRALDQDLTRLVQRAAPPQIRRFMNALQIVQDDGDIRDPYTGKIVYRTEEKYSEALKAAFGTPSLRLAQERAKLRVVNRETERIRDLRESFLRQIAEARSRGDTDKVRSLIRESREAGLLFTREDLVNAVRRFEREQRVRLIQRAPRELERKRPELFERP